LDLLAPGSALRDFVLVTNEEHRGLRTVAFLQHYQGFRVEGGQLSFRFKNDRLIVIASEALPILRGIDVEDVGLDAERLVASAIQDVKSQLPAGRTVDVVGVTTDAILLPMVNERGVLGFSLTRAVEVAALPIGRWDVHLDAATGLPVARQQLLRFATGNLVFNVPERRPGSVRLDYPAANAFLNNSNTATDAAGGFTFNGTQTQVQVGASGPLVDVNNVAGPEVSRSVTVNDGETAVVGAADEPEAEAQLNAFIHAQRAKSYVSSFSGISFLTDQLDVSVNIDDACNAFYDGRSNSINFYQSDNRCDNTALLSDVVMHEFGHALHLNTLLTGSGEFDGALSEGISDYLAATISNDSGMGRGFFYTDEPLRELNPVGREQTWPDDVSPDPRGVHQTGQIIGGTLWDMRQNLIDRLGFQEGVAVADRLFYEGTRNASDIPSMYPEVLAADDDNGDLSDGTPHVCEISEAFESHGLRTLNIEAPDISVEPPTVEDHEVRLSVVGLFTQCESDRVGSAEVRWRNQTRAPDLRQTLQMESDAESLVGRIPVQLSDSVVRFRVEVEMESGRTFSYPENEADLEYQFYVGELEEIFCTGFETDPFSEGWVSGLAAGEYEEGANDWAWGPPAAPEGSGDPPSAYAGDNIIGNDIGGDRFNGLYQADKVNFVESPVIDASGFDAVRLQYRRWLQVEDGFFDQAVILANGEAVWSNLASPQEEGATVHHLDREWRFHDVELTDALADDGSVQVRYEIRSDGGLQFGGWSLDEWCVLGYRAPQPECGNGTLEVGEACDDGNIEDGDGCSSTCEEEDEASGAAEENNFGDFEVSSGCGCRIEDSARDDRALWFILAGLGLGLTRRRRRG
ncbi:MAG: M36 family metallopeptidase, partial [Myxococcota bacterium]